MRWHRITAMLWNYYYNTINSADRLFDIFYWPLLDLFIWGFMTHFIQGISDVNILSMILGGIILWVFLWRSSQDVAVYVLENFWSRNVYHLFASPLTIKELAVSLFIMGAIRSVLSFFTVSLVSFALYQFNIFTFNFFHVGLFVSILLIFAWALGLLVTSFIFRYGTRVQVLGWSTIWIIQPFSCVFYPLSALPSWAAKIAIILPTTHVFEGLRASLSNQPLHYFSLFYSFVFSLLFFILCAWILSAAVHKAKRRGSLGKPE